MSANAFRFQSIWAFLTYSNIGNFVDTCVFADAVIDHLTTMGNDAFKYRLAVEVHHDEDYLAANEEARHHLHVLAYFGKKVMRRGTDLFDVEGHHPNIVKPTAEQRRNQFKYLEKDG